MERRTLATSTVAGRPLPLPAWATTTCEGFGSAATRLRSLTGLLLSLFARSADAVIDSTGDAFLRDQRNSLDRMASQGTLLEHFHRYRAGDTNQSRALDMHTDAGLLQVLLVRWRAQGANPGELSRKQEPYTSGLEVQLPNGQLINAEVEMMPSDSNGGALLFLVGQGAENWLSHLGLRAAPHAVSVGNDWARQERLVYGVMLLPPPEWKLTAPGDGIPDQATFADFWSRAQRALQGDGREDSEIALDGCMSSTLLERRLVDLSSSCQAGSIYCWMQCQAVPKDIGCSFEEAVCMSNTRKQLCPAGPPHDPSCVPTCPPTDDLVLEVTAGENGSSGIYKAEGEHGGKRLYSKMQVDGSPFAGKVQWDSDYKMWVLFGEGYKDSMVLYFSEMDTQAPPKQDWQIYLGAPPTPRLSFTQDGNKSEPDTGPSEDAGFCNGILTDMHMSGFEVARQSVPCIIFFFQGLELTSAWKFVLAMLATILLGILVEFMVAARRWSAPGPSKRGTLFKWKLSRRGTKAWSLLLYAVTRALGYLVMLVTMTYSVELFLSVIVGLTAGHAIFNLETPADSDATPCCAASSGPVEGVRQGEKADSAWPSKGSVAKINIEGMTCNSCINTVRHAIEALDEVEKVLQISLNGLAVLQLRSSAGNAVSPEDDLASVCSAIEAVGFSACQSTLITEARHPNTPSS
eukprot:TRINITY_DN95260_c0_g1_i1.p1 TRINITY_DN95260_c0_g1~~TRINITY_DN95260_c0_g1_i1.p1  ORF type:complete len:806 (+),score=162.39 TRINITY_DN95260_c0_g1_i1:355-2418(+)